jgi:hypothetical protein
MTMVCTARKQTNRKAKKSFTLSVEYVGFLETLRKRRRAPSASSVLGEIIQAARRLEHKKTLETAVSDYYTSLSTNERGEVDAWGKLGVREFPQDPGGLDA